LAYFQKSILEKYYKGFLGSEGKECHQILMSIELTLDGRI
jgi:hypothetical protein